MIIAPLIIPPLIIPPLIISPLIVSIDGGVASGKSAVGRRVADRLRLPFLDSGLMYRAIARLATQRGIDPRDAEAVTRLAEDNTIRLQGERVWADGVELTDGIYDTDYADALPIISAIPGVRKALVAQQRRMGESGVVMAGRDIGTVVFPHADHKFFLVASLDEKVRRRAAQYERRGERVDDEAMRREVELRDRVDSQRPVAPLKPADDAVIIDTDNLDLDEVVERIVRKVQAGKR
jgi:cytidylate kinase